MSKSQLAIISVAFVIVLFFILVLSGFIPGLRPDVGSKSNILIWGVYLNSEQLAPGISAFREANPNISVTYEAKDPATYESDLINALALGTGPDIVMIHNTWLPKHINKIYPAPETIFTLKNLRELFPTVVEQDLSSAGRVFGLPLYIDTLALFYNQSLFDAANLTSPPLTWEDFLDDVKELKEVDKKGNITQAATALGGSLDSINKSSDILSLLMLQSGTKMVADDFSRASFTDKVNNQDVGEKSFLFYTQFANPKSSYYTWNDSQGKDVNAFAEGKVAMVFNYSYLVEELKNKNPFLSFSISKMPQLENAPLPVNYPDYWALSVLNRSPNKNNAWHLISFLTANEQVARNFYKISQRPPALRSLLSECQQDLDISSFCQQTLTARSWPQVDKNKISLAFSEAVKDVVQGRLSVESALRKAQDSISLLMK